MERLNDKAYVLVTPTIFSNICTSTVLLWAQFPPQNGWASPSLITLLLKMVVIPETPLPAALL
jgi:hypothetical protein